MQTKYDFQVAGLGFGFVNQSTKTGGSLNLVATGDCDSWDPANTYYGWCWNMQRLFTRTLVGYSSVPGANNVVAPVTTSTTPTTEPVACQRRRRTRR